jgi:hypothetical protein
MVVRVALARMPGAMSTSTWVSWLWPSISKGSRFERGRQQKQIGPS